MRAVSNILMCYNVIKGGRMKDRIKTELIEDYIAKNNLTLDEFCQLSNISKQDIQKIFDQNFDFAIDVLYKLAKTLHVQIYLLFER